MVQLQQPLPQAAFRRSFTIAGPAGTGKSHFVRALRAWAEAWWPHSHAHKIRTCAQSAKAAAPIGGVTIHKLGGIPAILSRAQTAPGRPLSPADRKRRAALQGVVCIIVDEKSMCGGKLLAVLSDRLRYLLGVNTPFGGAMVVLMGDFGQLPPVGDTPLYLIDAALAAGREPGVAHAMSLHTRSLLETARVLWQQLAVGVVHFPRNERQRQDQGFATLLAQLRRGTVPANDLSTLLQRAVLRDAHAATKRARIAAAAEARADTQRAPYIPIITCSNDERCYFNALVIAQIAVRRYNAAAAAHARGDDIARCELLAALPVRFAARVEFVAGDMTPDMARVLYAKRDEQLGGRPLVTEFFVGMPVMATVSAVVPNGFAGYVSRMSFSSNARLTLMQLRATGTANPALTHYAWLASEPPVCVWVRAEAPPIAAAPAGAADAPEFPVMVLTQIHKVTMGRGENQRQASVRITTLPLVPAYAITAWKAQGATYDSLVLASLPLQPQPSQRHLLYVILSRVRTAAGLFTINTISPSVAGLYGPDPQLHQYFAAAQAPDDAAENLAADI